MASFSLLCTYLLRTTKFKDLGMIFQEIVFTIKVLTLSANTIVIVEKRSLWCMLLANHALPTLGIVIFCGTESVAIVV